jgi:hypothetical protein
LNHPPALFCDAFFVLFYFVFLFFEIGSYHLFVKVWLRTSIPLISAFWVPVMTGVSHRAWPRPAF